MFITPAYAQAAGGVSAPGGATAFLIQFAPLLALFVVGYFLLIRPQQKRAQALAATIGAVKKGDQVVTSGGILGRVTRVEDSIVEVEIAPNTRIRVVKATLAEVTTNAATKPAND